MPSRPWALGLCLFAAFAFAIDIQTAIPRLWTWIGLLCWGIGPIFFCSMGLEFRLSPLSRESAESLQRCCPECPQSSVRGSPRQPWVEDGLIGLGVDGTGINPDGLVEVEGAPWRALTE